VAEDVHLVGRRKLEAGTQLALAQDVLPLGDEVADESRLSGANSIRKVLREVQVDGLRNKGWSKGSGISRYTSPNLVPIPHP